MCVLDPVDYLWVCGLIDSWITCFCREFVRRPSRSPLAWLSRSTTPSSLLISTPTREWLARLPSFLPREWEIRLLVSSPTWWREFREALSAASPLSCRRRRERLDWTSSLRYNFRLVSCNGYNIRERTAVSILGLRLWAEHHHWPKISTVLFLSHRDPPLSRTLLLLMPILRRCLTLSTSRICPACRSLRRNKFVHYNWSNVCI